jgi:hypothetical protein
MPNMASITVKDANNVDTVYTAVQPSSGDRNPAIWRNNASTAIMGLRPTFRYALRNNGNNTARVIEGSMRFPVFVDKDGIDTQLAIVPLSFSGTLPTNVSTDWVTDAFIQFGNLLVSTLVRTSVNEMTAPT